MTEEEAYTKKLSITNDIEELVESGYYSIEEIVSEIKDTLCHLY